MENRRLLFAALLSILVVIGWQQLMQTLHPPAEPSPVSPAAVGEPGEPFETAAETPANEAPAETTSPRTTGEGLLSEAETFEPLLDFDAESVAAELEEHAILETPEIRAEFTNLGAQLVSIRLQMHRNASGEPLELVRPRGTDPYPFALIVDGRQSHPLNKALFETTRETGENGETILRFRHKSERGTAEKVFRFTPEGLLGAEITVSGRGPRETWGIVLGPGVRQFEQDEDVSSRFIQRRAVYLRGDEAELVDFKDVDQDLYLPGAGLTWVGLEDNFFLHAAIPRAGLREAVIRPILQRTAAEPGQARFLPWSKESESGDLTRDFLVLLEAGGERLEVLNFFGAKQYRLLTSLPHQLEKTVDWGFLGVLSRPLYFGLTWVHEHVVANYGWAIVLVTCLIKLLFLPLTFKSQQSMTKMQELNPKVQAIRSKFRGKLKDKQGRPNIEAQRAMNEEVMAVYKEAGVNPVSGCVPILIQMPVFFAFYRLLLTAVELRGAEWIGWIHDLSNKDPYYLLPIVMGVTSLGMQRMMPSAGDPMQRRLMQMMPIMFTVFAFAFPSGLVLYWMTNNLLTMLQQALMLKLRKDDEGPGGKAKALEAKSKA